MSEALEERLAPYPEERPDIIQTLEVLFGLPVHITRDQYRRLNNLIEEIVKAPYNQLRHGVHWVSGEGARPNFSAVDAAFLGVPSGPAEVQNGDEPVFDYDVHQIMTTARGFINERERQIVERERAVFDICSVCQEPRYRTPSGPACKNGHGGD